MMYAMSSVLDSVDVFLMTNESYQKSLEEKKQIIEEQGYDYEKSFSTFQDIMGGVDMISITDIDTEEFESVDNMFGYLPGDNESVDRFDAKTDLLNGKAVADGDIIDYIVDLNK